MRVGAVRGAGVGASMQRAPCFVTLFLRVCGAVEQCDGDGGLTVALKMDVLMLRCGNGQEMREKELRACRHTHTAVLCG
jgi:hypothetical protein